MTDLIRGTVSGHFIRLISGKLYLPYGEDRDNSLWKRYVDAEKSGRMAHRGHTGEEESNGEGGSRDRNSDEKIPGRSGSQASSNTRVASQEEPRDRTEPGGVKVDPEKGKYFRVISWLSDDDPKVGTLSRVLRPVANSS
jgi:MFS transporter, DHA1 family, multidrug resistance protein